MKKKIRVDFFCESKKWPRRLPKIRSITNATILKMNNYFIENYIFNLNLILSNKKNVINLNKKYKKKYKDTDVLTFVSKFSNKDVGKNLYCDIFFSIDTIEAYIKKNKVNLYDHFNHLLIHSILHINGYDHKNLFQFKKMKNIEIKILKQFGIRNPYYLNE